MDPSWLPLLFAIPLLLSKDFQGKATLLYFAKRSIVKVLNYQVHFSIKTRWNQSNGAMEKRESTKAHDQARFLL